MSLSSQEYRLDIIPGNHPVMITCSTYDTGRSINFTLYNGNVKYSIPGNSTVTIIGYKPSGEQFSHVCSYSGSIVTIELQDDMTDEEGLSVAELKIVDVDEKSLGTGNICILCEQSTISEDVRVTDAAAAVFNELLNKAQSSEAEFNNVLLQLQEGIDELNSNIELFRNGIDTLEDDITYKTNFMRSFINFELVDTFTNTYPGYYSYLYRMGNIMILNFRILATGSDSHFVELGTYSESIPKCISQVAQIYDTRMAKGDNVMSMPIHITVENRTIKYKSLAGTDAVLSQGMFVFLIEEESIDSVVTSENIYSEDEKRIGTWIDGKSLYQKVIIINSLPNNSTGNIAHGIQNISNIVGEEFLIRWQDGWITNAPWIVDGDSSETITISAGLSNIQVVTKKDRTNMSAIIILKYTKTTDPLTVSLKVNNKQSSVSIASNFSANWTAKGGSEDYQYALFVDNLTGSGWEQLSSWNTSTHYSFSTTYVGKKKYMVRVKDTSTNEIISSNVVTVTFTG